MKIWRFEWFFVRNPYLAVVIILIPLLAFLLLVSPILYVLVWSLFGTSTVGIMNGLTFYWYTKLFTHGEWLFSLGYSFLLGILSSLGAVIGALSFFYFTRWRGRFYQILGLVLLVGPLFFPTLIYALALRIVSVKLMLPEFVSLLIAHITLILPVQYILIESAGELIKDEVIYGAAVAGANHFEILRYVVAPLIYRPLVIATIIGFLLSFDELVVANMILDTPSTTIPKRLWDGIHRIMDPMPAVVGSLILLILLVSLFLLIRRKGEWESAST